MNKLKKFVALALVLCMILTVMPVYANAASEDFLRVYHLDCGRKFFDTAEVEELIDLLSENGYTHLELALGNDGLRLILDDMSVLTYDAAAVTAGIKAGNLAYSHAGEWTEAQMDAIIDYAAERNIEIIPLINTPGHMDAILAAMSKVGIKNAAYNGSERTVDVTNAKAVEFTQALVAKYVEYFADKGCTYFNMGADEYANDKYTGGSMGFGHLQSEGLYDEYADYVNGIAAIIKDAGMTPIAFNDGLYFNNNNTKFDTDIVAAYWTSGWGDYKVASARTLANKGHKILNTNDGWYYVLGRASGTYGYNGASKNVVSTPVTDVPGSNDPAVIGAMACLWCDEPNVSYASNESKVHYLIETLADSNPDYFVPAPPVEEPEPEVTEPVETEPVTETDPETGIAVSAPGLTGMTAVEAEAPAIEAADHVAAWDLTPATETGAYTGEATVSVPVPAGWNTDAMGAFVVNADGTVTMLAGTYEGGSYTYTCPHFSVTGIYDVAAAADVLETEERAIEVEMGKTVTDTILGGDYTDAIDETGLNKTIATVGASFAPVTVTGEPVKAGSVTSGGTYIIGNGSGRYMVVSGTSISSTTDAAQATKFTVTSSNGSWKIQTGNYYLRHNNNSLSVSTTNSSNTWSYDGTRFYYTSGSSTYRLNTDGDGNWRVSTSTSRQGAAYTVTSTTTPATTVTFTGVKQGTTHVTVGNVRYTITVKPENLSNAASLTVEYWITNIRVTADNANSKTISARDAYGENGVLISSLIPASGRNASNAEVAFWKTTRLASNNKQTESAGVNKTLAGTDFTYVRYYGGSWAYSADGVTWINVASGDQIVAYYLQVTEVTEEVTTQVVDWGEMYGNNYNDDNYVLVDYAVKYESGERTPNAFPINGTTQKFHCNYNSQNDINYGNVVRDSRTNVYYRNLWSIRAVETSEYEVYMITLTPTDDSATEYLSRGADSEATGQRNFYAGTEKVVWVDDEANLGDFADESLHYTSISGDVKFTVGGEPVVPELEIYNRHGMLVTYYVRAKATEDALTVHYIDATEGANNLEFYSYNIAVKEGTTFKTGIALPNPWKGNLVNGDVVNYYGRTQHVSSDLSTLSQIGAQYLYTDYECIRVERVDDKNVNLYYTFNPTAYFVADFGLPMMITAADLSDALKGANITEMKFSGSRYTAYGQLTDNGNTITYTPTKILNGIDYFTLLVETVSADLVEGGANGQVAFRVYIVPATTVYYDETFVTLNGDWTASNPENTAQETQRAGEAGLNYGYTEASMERTFAVSAKTGNTAVFSFTGTGVEIYADATTTSGVVTAVIYGKNDKGEDTIEKVYQVNTVAKDGLDPTATGGQAQDSYGLPIISVSGLNHGTHRVELYHSGAGEKNILLDGFRVTDTLGDLASNAFVESEKNPHFVELRNAVLTAQNVEISDAEPSVLAGRVSSQVFAELEDDLNGALVLSNNASYDVADLLNNGPKNELFLRKGESVSFDLGSRTAQIGLKALNGKVTCTVNGRTYEIDTAVDMFYGKVSGKVTIVNTGDNILSVTKLKVLGAASAAVALEPISQELVTHALQMMGIIEKPAPVNPFVDVAEDSWYYDSVMWAVEEGITTGADATHFLPDALCQRASVVTFLWRAAGSPEPETNVNPFVDVTEDTFFYKAVLWAVENGITNGVDATHFAPFGTCNRAQVVTFLWRANGSPAASAVNPFADVAEGQWYTDAIVWAVENGITNGMSGSIFGVDSICNRAQIVTFLYRASVNVK